MRYAGALARGTIAACLLLLTLAGCSKAEEVEPAEVMERAYAATVDETTSFHFVTSDIVVAEGMGEMQSFSAEGDYQAPDRVRMSLTQEEGPLETMLIGKVSYARDPETLRWGAYEFYEAPPGGWADPRNRLDFMEGPGDKVVRLDDEVINGVECWHFRVSNYVLATLIQAVDEAIDPEAREARQEMVDQWEAAATTNEIDVWIGKEDYLVRQTRSVLSQSAPEEIDDTLYDIAIPQGTTLTSTTMLNLSGFNEPVVIEAPTNAEPAD